MSTAAQAAAGALVNTTPETKVLSSRPAVVIEERAVGTRHSEALRQYVPTTVASPSGPGSSGTPLIGSPPSGSPPSGPRSDPHPSGPLPTSPRPSGPQPREAQSRDPHPSGPLPPNAGSVLPTPFGPPPESPPPQSEPAGPGSTPTPGRGRRRWLAALAAALLVAAAGLTIYFLNNKDNSRDSQRSSASNSAADGSANSGAASGDQSGPLSSADLGLPSGPELSATLLVAAQEIDGNLDLSPSTARAGRPSSA